MSTAEPRRIRFAPLPDPRRSVLITDDGLELPLATVQDDELKQDFSSSSPLPALRLSLPASIPASVSLNAISPAPSISPSSSLLPPTPPSYSVPLPPTVKQSSNGNTWPKVLLKPFSSNGHNRIRSPSPSPSPSPYSSSACSGTSSSASSMHSLTPTQSIDPLGSSTPTQPHPGGNHARARFLRSNFSTEQILTLGTINFFRSSPKEGDSENGGWGSALTRWTSSGSANSIDGAPLSRTQSTQSFKGGNVRISSRRSSSPSKSKQNSAHANGLIGTLHSGSPKKGTRMLNGRVYGARRGGAANTANPFANAKDDPDPEFVEWGYGGMGSVKSDGVGGRVWGRLMSDGTGLYDSRQKNQKAGVGEKEEGRREGRCVDADDMDDGSGMGWVRRRREQREREKKEREEKEAKEKEAEQVVTPPAEPTPIPTPTSEPPTPAPMLRAPSVGSVISPTPIPLPSPPAIAPAVAPQADQHVMRAVTVPAPVFRHHSSHHGHGHHRSKSNAMSISSGEGGTADEDSVVAAAPPEEAEPVPVPISTPKEPEAEVDAETYTHDPRTRNGSVSSSSSTSTSDEDSSDEHADVDEDADGDDDGEDEEEEEEEEEEREQRRKTSLGAGVEKISTLSRHK